MIKTIIGRYLLFSVLGIEALILPYFLDKNTYAEVEFLKFTIFLMQFSLIGAATGFVVKAIDIKNEDNTNLAFTLLLGGMLHAILASLLVYYFYSWEMALLCFLGVMALIFESIAKVDEKYLLAMSFKPIFSLIVLIFLPLIYLFEISALKFVLITCVIATFIYSSFILKFSFKSIGINGLPFDVRIKLNVYISYIRQGFMMNIATVMTFVFFYIDRLTIKNLYPELLPDYSLSFSIMQLTIVAITTFSYVNIISFGKEANNIHLLEKKIVASFKKCFLFYLIMGCFSIVFSFYAEKFYGYEQVFYTTTLMVTLFGLANVFSSLNSAHLYLGTVKVMSGFLFVALAISWSLNQVIFSSMENAYYLLLAKTYGLFLVFSILSSAFIFYKLHLIKK